MTLKNIKGRGNMKKIVKILTNLLKGGKILKGLKIVKEILNFLKAILIIIGGSFIVNTLEFINSFRFLNSSIITMITNCITWTMYLYIVIQTIKTLLRFIPLIKEIIENPISKKVIEWIKERLKKDDDIILEAEEVEEVEED